MAFNEKPQTAYVTLVSSDGFEFKILRSAACIAPTIKNMLNPASTVFFLGQSADFH
jgi:transcription elongation factor B subunit 1